MKVYCKVQDAILIAQRLWLIRDEKTFILVHKFVYASRFWS